MNSVRLNEYLKTMYDNVVMASPADSMQWLSGQMYTSTVWQKDASTMILSFAGHTFELKTNSLPWFATADGGVVTDFCLQTRELMNMLCSPAFGRRFTKKAQEFADWYRSVVLGFFSGAETAGAVYAFGNWSISQRWLPVPPPQVMPLSAALYDDPFSTIARTYQQTDSIHSENITKAMKLSVDPLYHMYKVSGKTVLTVPSYTFKDVSTLFRDWNPTLVHAGGDDMDVVMRQGTFQSNDEVGDWRSGAFDPSNGAGRVMSLLQTPAVFDERGIASRLSAEQDGWWFRKTDHDYKLGGSISQVCVDAMADQTSLKMSWLCQRLGATLQPGSRVTALYCSPLYFINQEAYFRKPLEKPMKKWTVTMDAMAYVRSDPAAPTGILRLASEAGRSVSLGWLTEAEQSYLAKKGFVN